MVKLQHPLEGYATQCKQSHCKPHNVKCMVKTRCSGLKACQYVFTLTIYTFHGLSGRSMIYQRGAHNPGGRGHQPINWSNFQKVANMKKIVPGVRPKLVYVDPSLIALTLQNRKQCLVFLAQYIKFKRPLIIYRISRKVDCVEQFVRKCDNKPLGKIEEWRKGCKDIE